MGANSFDTFPKHQGLHHWGIGGREGRFLAASKRRVMNITTTVGYTGGLDPSALGRLEEAIANYDPQFVPINLVMYELGE